jgi:hypothetical protein
MIIWQSGRSVCQPGPPAAVIFCPNANLRPKARGGNQNYAVLFHLEWVGKIDLYDLQIALPFSSLHLQAGSVGQAGQYAKLLVLTQTVHQSLQTVYPTLHHGVLL